MQALAFLLPQFHPISENDAWWGKGFTEWRNVVKAKPLFRGHYQPHIPADLGFYDLRLPETREAQAHLARAHGITGFCYYHYWFNGRRLLNRPIDDIVASGKPDFPFCFCWANENWTRRWDGLESEVLLQQDYSDVDDRAHIRHLIDIFADDRYIKVDGRPLFLVYRSALLPAPERTADIWRAACREAGFPGLYLVRVESHEEVDPSSIGFDAAAEFAPNWSVLPETKFKSETWDVRARIWHWLQKAHLMSSAYQLHKVYSYERMSRQMQTRASVPYVRFRCAMPSWDNSARREHGARIFDGSTPALYEAWLAQACRETMSARHGDEQIVFINAWNEWAEGNHLEPDQRWGNAYLAATRRAIASVTRHERHD